LKVECGVEYVRDAHQKVDVGRLNARVQGIERRGNRGAVIALDIMPCARGWRSFGHRGLKGMITQRQGARNRE
jgi:hypothetical protein